VKVLYLVRTGVCHLIAFTFCKRLEDIYFRTVWTNRMHYVLSIYFNN